MEVFFDLKPPIRIFGGAEDNQGEVFAREWCGKLAASAHATIELVSFEYHYEEVLPLQCTITYRDSRYIFKQSCTVGYQRIELS